MTWFTDHFDSSIAWLIIVLLIGLGVGYFDANQGHMLVSGAFYSILALIDPKGRPPAH